MLFIKLDHQVSLYDLSAIYQLRLVASINMLSETPELYFTYKEGAKFIIHSSTDDISEMLISPMSMSHGFTNGCIQGLSLFIDNDFYDDAIEVLNLLKAHKIRAFMILMDDSKVSLDDF